MTTHCANSECGTPFRYFRSGRIFLIDFKATGMATSPSRDMEETRSDGTQSGRESAFRLAASQ
jgi:hypothetical protein